MTVFEGLNEAAQLENLANAADNLCTVALELSRTYPSIKQALLESDNLEGHLLEFSESLKDRLDYLQKVVYGAPVREFRVIPGGKLIHFQMS